MDYMDLVHPTAKGPLRAITSALSRVSLEDGVTADVAVLLQRKAWLSRDADRDQTHSDLRAHSDALNVVDPLLACILTLDSVVLGSEDLSLDTLEPVYSAMSALLDMPGPTPRYVIAQFWIRLARKFFNLAYFEVGETASVALLCLPVLARSRLAAHTHTGTQCIYARPSLGRPRLRHQVSGDL
jgi:hypothetical protein